MIFGSMTPVYAASNKLVTTKATSVKTTVVWKSIKTPLAAKRASTIVKIPQSFKQQITYECINRKESGLAQWATGPNQKKDLSEVGQAGEQIRRWNRISDC